MEIKIELRQHLSERSVNILSRANLSGQNVVEVKRKLSSFSEDRLKNKLLRTRGCGTTCVNEILNWRSTWNIPIDQFSSVKQQDEIRLLLTSLLKGRVGCIEYLNRIKNLDQIQNLRDTLCELSHIVDKLSEEFNKAEVEK